MSIAPHGATHRRRRRSIDAANEKARPIPGARADRDETARRTPGGGMERAARRPPAVPRERADEPLGERRRRPGTHRRQAAAAASLTAVADVRGLIRAHS